jgi:multiple sugar transport system ATP-binding protein
MVDVKLVNISKKFGNIIAVNNVNLEVRDNEFMVLLGPSGSGKTTTLRMIAGLETPTSGDIYFGEDVVTHLPPRNRDVAMVFQSYALYPHLKVYDNISLPLKVRKYSPDEIKHRVKEVAEMLRIIHLLDRKPSELSGGEQQRVALARAIVRKAKVFLMDEPLSNLDAKLRVYMRAELKRLQKDLKITTIYVTHDQIEAMSMADRIAIFNLGSIYQIGSPDDIYKKPQNMFVAGFVGSPPMNFIDCTFKEKNGKAFLDVGTFMIDISKFKEIIMKQAVSSELVLGIRPEDVSIYKERPSTESFKAEVYVTEPLGAEIIIDLKVGETIVKAKASPDIELHIGETIWVTFNKDKIYIFDRKTQKIII